MSPRVDTGRILLVTNWVTPDHLGGLQRYVRELATALSARGLDVTVLSRAPEGASPGRSVQPDGVTLLRYRVPGRRHPLYAAGYPAATLAAVARAVARFPGVVHVHFPPQALGVLLARRRYVHTFHAPMHKEVLPEHQARYALPAPLRTPLVGAVRATEALIADRAAQTLVLSEFMRSELAQLAPRAAHRAIVVPGGVDTVHFSPGPPDAGTPRRDRGPRLFTARRFVPRTGVTELVEAMRHIEDALPGTTLDVAGDGPLRPELERRIATLGLEDHVRLLGRISDEDLLRRYREADLFVLPTQQLEGFGLSTGEALACGIPAVGTPVGATPELLAPLDERLLARSTDPQDIAEAVIRVCSAPGLLGELSGRARERAETTMSWARVAEAHLAVYARHAGPA